MSANTKSSKVKSFFKSPARITLLIAGLFLIISLVESITGSVDISSPGTSGATLRFAIPLLMAGLGGLWAERAGVSNMGGTERSGQYRFGRHDDCRNLDRGLVWLSTWPLCRNSGRNGLWISLWIFPCRLNSKDWY